MNGHEYEGSDSLKESVDKQNERFREIAFVLWTIVMLILGAILNQHCGGNAQ